jgi:hypothetical protein
LITLVGDPRGVAVIRAELRDVVAPAVTDPRAAMSLKMIDMLLGQLERLIDHQGAWMHEEIAAIEELADAALEEAPELPGVADALDGLRTGRARSEHLDEVRAEYYLASELLSLIIEGLAHSSGSLQDRALDVLGQRLDREVAIRGEFELVGQTG